MDTRGLPVGPWRAIRWWLGGLLLIAAAPAFATDWQLAGETARRELDGNLAYAARTVSRSADGRRFSAHLTLFNSRAFRLEVIDLGAAPGPDEPTLAEAFRSRGCVAGVNGGFFHPDGQPLGLMIAGGQRINRLERARLLSGLVYGDARGIHLVRWGRFQDHPGIDALLQSGPYLVEGGDPVRGLSESAFSRRAFIATDWRGRWLLGVTPDAISLAELATALASPGALSPWPIDRALNLDGGSSSGFFFARGPGDKPVVLTPGKRVRNLLGIRPRRDGP